MAPEENLPKTYRQRNDSEFFDFNIPFPTPDPLSFPTNEGNFTVLERIISDSRDSKEELIVSGYAGLDQVISFISNHAKEANIRIVFGHEPSTNKKLPKSHSRLGEEMRDFWLERGFSPRTNASVLESVKAIEEGRVKARIHTRKFLHAKAYRSQTAVTFGSSNFTSPGLETSRELNGRFLWGEKQYNEISKFMEGCWSASEDYTDKLLKLLRELQLHTTWEEALARSCAAVLEGHWAMDLLPNYLKTEMAQLWPHQRQAIAQSLTVLETQGAVVICDPTGAGKTREGGWLFRLAFNRIISRGGENLESLIPVMISPPSVENNWYQILDRVQVPREIISQGILSNQTKESTKRRLDLISRTNLLGVDEIHNYYNLESNRTKILRNNLADNRIFLTATPINRGFSDLIKLMNLLGTAELDGETFRKMKNLDEKINDPNPKIREEARRSARKLVQRFMVRRTRDEIKEIVSSRPDEYRLGDRVANYPEYVSLDYNLNSKSDDHLVELIEEKVQSIRGLTRLRELKQSKKERDFGTSEQTHLKMRLNSSAALSRHQIWDTLDSSVAALYEHAYGTEAAEEKFQVKTGKGQAPSHGMLNTLKQMDMPVWGLSKDLFDSPETPDWITDSDKFDEIRNQEINIYEEIVELSLRMSDNRQEAKLNMIRQGIRENKKPLAFDSSIITLSLMEKILKEQGIETELFTGTDGRSKKKKVQRAESIFGLNSEDRPVVGLLSDSMSEGINLQGSSLLINLTRPSTIKDAEQRAGRVDRMDSKFDEITIKYPERDRITAKKAPHLIQRAKLVRDLIGSNIKLPEDLQEVDQFENELDPSTKDFDNQLFRDRDGLMDAFHEIRKLIGDGGLVSEETYESMRTSEARVVSCVGLVRSDSPWCFAVVQTNKKWAPQWVFLDWERRKSTRGHGIFTQSDEVCSLLRARLREAQNISPSDHSDRWIGEFSDFLNRNEFDLLSLRKQKILRQMSNVLRKWQNKFGHQSKIGELLGDIRRAATGKSGDSLDMRQLATAWNSFVRNHVDKVSAGMTKSKKTKLDQEPLLIQNPPENIENFVSQMSNVEYSEDFDTRIVAFIAGIPNYEDPQD